MGVTNDGNETHINVGKAAIFQLIKTISMLGK